MTKENDNSSLNQENAEDNTNFAAENHDSEQNQIKEGQEQDEVLALKNKISELELVISSQNDKILRSLADIENIRRRSGEELEKSTKFAISKFAGDLILAVENFYLAVENMPSEEIEKSDRLKNFATGVVMTQKELIKIFEKNAIKRINPINEKFDHNYHQAIAQSEGGGESGTVTKVVQAGYVIHDRLIRPALVEIAK